MLIQPRQSFGEVYPQSVLFIRIYKPECDELKTSGTFGIRSSSLQVLLCVKERIGLPGLDEIPLLGILMKGNRTVSNRNIHTRGNPQVQAPRPSPLHI